MNKKEHMIDNHKKYLELCGLGKTREEIANEIGVTLRTICEYQKRLGVSARNKYDLDGNIEKYISMCNSGCTKAQISQELRVTIKTVEHYAKRTGVKPRSGRKASINENYFDVIDSEEKAYFLGLLSADGYIDSSEKTVCLALNQKDVDAIYKIKQATNCKNNITRTSTPNCVCLNMCSKHMVKTLSRYGIVRNKSKILPFPELPPGLYRHFFRGYCDGDGCVHKRQVVIVVGSKCFLDGAVDYLEEAFHRKMSVSPMGTYYRLVLSRKDLDVIQWMYDGATVSLDRKQRSYNENWLSYAEKRRTIG